MSYSLYINPDRPSWLKFRMDGIGGSDVASIRGHSPWTSPRQLAHDKKNRVEGEDISDKPKVKAGVILEPVIRRMFAENHPELFVFPTNIGDGITTFVSDERPWAMADLDAIAIDVANPDRKPIVVEIKTAHMPFAKDWKETWRGSDGVPKHYLEQVEHYFSITGWDEAYVVVWIDGFDYREYHFKRDDFSVDEVAKDVDEFWTRYVLGDEVPDQISPSDSKLAMAAHPNPGTELLHLDSDSEVEEVLELVDALTEAKNVKKTAEAQIADASVRLKDIIGDAKGIATEYGNITWVKNMRPKVDLDAMRDDDPIVVAAYDKLREKHTVQVPVDGGIRWNRKTK